MYTVVSDNYKITINGYSRRFAARLKRDGDILAAEIKSYSLGKYSSTGEDFCIGCAFSSSVTISCVTDATLKDQEVVLETGLYIGTEVEYVPDGVYTITSAKKKNLVTELTGYDRMYTAGQNTFQVPELPCLLSAAAVAVAEQLGCEFDNTCLSGVEDLTLETMPAGTLSDISGYLAGLIGRNAYIDRSGKLTFQAYADCSYEFDGNRISDMNVDSSARKINWLECSTGDTDEDVLQSGSGSGYARFQNPMMTQAILDNITAGIAGFSYYGAEIPFLLGDNRLDPWDIITYTGDNEYKILCHEIIFNFDGGLQMDVTSHALSELEHYVGPTQKVVEQAKQQVAEVKKALYFHNCRGTTGRTGYVKFAQITITSGWQNVPIILHVLQRNRTENILSIWYQNTNDLDPDLKDFFHYGGQELYLEHAGEGVWNLYAKKTDAYDSICVTQVYKADYMRHVKITWLDEHYDDIPDCVISRATIPGTELLVSTAVIPEMITPADAGRVLVIKAGTYDQINIKDTDRLTVILGGLIKCSGDILLSAVNCKDLRIFGGTVKGNGAQIGIKLENCLRPTISHVNLLDIGTAEQEDTAAIRMLGDCSGFSVDRCYISGVNAGVVSSDGFIHAYGIQVNRLGSSNAYSQTGNISGCSIENVAGTDSADTKADGDGIFINNPPYMDDSGNVNWRDDINITIDNCTINNCKKRGIKLASVGVKVHNAYVDGEMWYAGIDCQYGHADIEGCTVINTSDYNGSITSAIVASEGGVRVRKSTIKAPYGEYTYHPGIRFNKRLPASVVPDTVPWDDIYIEDCYFDKVSRAVYGYVSDETAPVPAKGIHIKNCRIGDFNQARAVEISDTMFSSIEAFELVDFRFDYGANRTEVKEKNAEFKYPVGISLNPTISFDLHSKHWTDEPLSGYDGLPTSPHARIIYAGSNMGNIYYKEYTGHGSRIYGNRAPNTITSTLSKQLLYNSRIGDLYTDTTAGKIYICTVAGTSSTIGTWTAIN